MSWRCALDAHDDSQCATNQSHFSYELPAAKTSRCSYKSEGPKDSLAPMGLLKNLLTSRKDPTVRAAQDAPVSKRLGDLGRWKSVAKPRNKLTVPETLDLILESRLVPGICEEDKIAIDRTFSLIGSALHS